MKARPRSGRAAGAEAGLPAVAPAAPAAGRVLGDCSRRYSVQEKLALVGQYQEGQESMGAFCARLGLSTASLCKWRRALRAHGPAGLEPAPNGRNRKGRSGQPRSAEQRRHALETFAKSGMPQEEFGRLWGLSPWTLRDWLARYRRGGPKELEPKRPGRKAGAGFARRVSEQVRAEIARTKQRFPSFGLKRVRAFLARFQGVKVSTGTIARVLEERSIERAPPVRKLRRSKPVLRRFERAQPNQLWQTDITSFVMPRPHARVYLIVFLDDHSRFIVSHGLYLHQRGVIAKEALLEGIARFGKPRELLRDQGTQYFAWRGKSEFQRLLQKLGIQHVVARTHHPQTVGKCERFWETLKSELLERVLLEDLASARERVAHFIAHYNFFRPHQGIEGLVPADRFFGAQDALRKTNQARLARDELGLALAEGPRTGAYLFGQIGEEQVSVHGARGQLMVQTSSGLRQAIGLEELGAPQRAQGERDAERADPTGGEHEQCGERAQAAHAAVCQAPELRGADGDAAGSARAVAGGAAGGAAACARELRGDPVDVAGVQAARGGGTDAVDAFAAGLATEPAGLERYAGGPLEAAAHASAQGGRGECEERGQCGAEEEDRAAGGATAPAGGADPSAGAIAQARERAAAADEPGGERARWREQRASDERAG